MIVELKFYIGEMVYVRHDPNQFVRQITSIVIHPNNNILYVCSLGDSNGNFYDFELSYKANLVIKLGITEKPEEEEHNNDSTSF